MDIKIEQRAGYSKEPNIKLYHYTQHSSIIANQTKRESH